MHRLGRRRRRSGPTRRSGSSAGCSTSATCGRARADSDCGAGRFGELVAARRAADRRRARDRRATDATRSACSRGGRSPGPGRRSVRLTLTVNGEHREVDGVWEGESLLYALRERLGLPGLEERLRAGRVRLVLGLPRRRGRVRVPRARRAGGGARRRDGRGDRATGGRRCTRCSARSSRRARVQCGFCTPGLIVASHDLLRRNPRPSDPEIREALAGNLCRCTGYEKILDAVRLAGERIAEAGNDDAHGHRGLRDRDRRRGRDRVSRRAHRGRGRPDRRRR